jgi:hypothetical protein
MIDALPRSTPDADVGTPLVCACAASEFSIDEWRKTFGGSIERHAVYDESSACGCVDPSPQIVHADPPERDHQLEYRVCGECGDRVAHPDNGRIVQ